jgi:hypothetical protein
VVEDFLLDGAAGPLRDVGQYFQEEVCDAHLQFAGQLVGWLVLGYHAHAFARVRDQPASDQVVELIVFYLLYFRVECAYHDVHHVGYFCHQVYIPHVLLVFQKFLSRQIKSF